MTKKVNPYKLLGLKLQKARKKAKKTQTEVAKYMRTTQSDVSNIETGKRKVDVIELDRFLSIYNETLSSFLGDFSASLNSVASDQSQH